MAGQQRILTPLKQMTPSLECLGIDGRPFISLTTNSYLCFQTDHCFLSLPFSQLAKLTIEVHAPNVIITMI
jgi:hypothetical protein